MSKTTKLFCLANQAISSNITVAAFAVSLILTSSGVSAKQSALSALSDGRASFKVNKDNRDTLFAKPVLVKKSSPKTERAKDFDSSVKSEEYWKKLYAGLSKSKTKELPKKKPKVPPVVIGSRD